MNIPVITRLVLKDVYFLRWIVAVVGMAGIVAFVCLLSGVAERRVVGFWLFFGSLVGLVYNPLYTVMVERKERNVGFVMSLPITPADYMTAKFAANVLILIGLGVPLVLASIYAMALNPAVPAVPIPWIVLAGTTLLMFLCFCIAVAFLIESELWTVWTTIGGSILFVAFVGRMAYRFLPAEGTAAEAAHALAVWSPLALALLTSEIVVTALIVSGAYYLHSRKTDFL